MVDEYGGLDIVVNNAGVLVIEPFDSTSRADLERAVAVNVYGVWNCCRAALPHLSDGEGAIVNVSSVLGFVAQPNLSAYALTKGATLNFTRALAIEVGTDGVRVNAVCPAGVETAMTAEAYSDEDVRAERAGATPLGRLCDPSEVADSVAFLASERASYITGEALVVDGGYSVSAQ